MNTKFSLFSPLLSGLARLVVASLRTIKVEALSSVTLGREQHTERRRKEDENEGNRWIRPYYPFNHLVIARTHLTKLSAYFCVEQKMVQIDIVAILPSSAQAPALARLSWFQLQLLQPDRPTTIQTSTFQAQYYLDLKSKDVSLTKQALKIFSKLNPIGYGGH